MTNIERLAAVEAIRNLKARYCRLADARIWAQLAELFTPDSRRAFAPLDGLMMSETRIGSMA
jgi:hypothetical protein